MFADVFPSASNFTELDSFMNTDRYFHYQHHLQICQQNSSPIPEAAWQKSSIPYDQAYSTALKL